MAKKKVVSPKDVADAAQAKKNEEAKKKSAAAKRKATIAANKKKEADANKKAADEAQAKEEAAAKMEAPVKKTAIALPTSKPKTAPAKISSDNKIKYMLKEYAELCTKPAFAVKDRGVLINKLSTMIQYAIRNSNPVVLESMFTFFIKERRGLLAEEVVFQGISKLGNSTRMQMEVFYSAMMICVANKTSKKKMKIDLDRVREILKSEELVGFFSSKLR